MSNLKRALLEGTEYLETVKLKKPGGEVVEVQVRPLSSKEAAEVDALFTQGLEGRMNEQGKIQADVDVGKFQNQLWKADVRAVAYGLTHSDERWTDEEVSKLLPMWVKQLANVILQISGVVRPRVASFRVSGSASGGDRETGGS